MDNVKDGKYILCLLMRGVWHQMLCICMGRRDKWHDDRVIRDPVMVNSPLFRPAEMIWGGILSPAPGRLPKVKGVERYHQAARVLFSAFNGSDGGELPHPLKRAHKNRRKRAVEPTLGQIFFAGLVLGSAATFLVVWLYLKLKAMT